MSLKIYAFPLSPRSFKPLWLANHLGLDYEMTLVDFTKNGQNAPDWALSWYTLVHKTQLRLQQ